MPVPAAYAWLNNEPGPKSLLEAVKICGTIETPGKADNPLIIGWADEVARLYPGGYNNWAAEFYGDDSIAWCGLGHAIVHARGGNKPVDKYLSALAWGNFGTPVDRPMLGDTMVKPREGGGHVTMYVGEDSNNYHCLGANQNDAFNIVRYPKAGIPWKFRRPPYRDAPNNLRVVKLKAGGAGAAGREN